MDYRILGKWKKPYAIYRFFKYGIGVTQRTIYSKVEPIDKNVSNVEITVPWGKVAGKLWGSNENKQPILALHGWQDNAATFDILAPLLEKHGPILALDLPGHGFSSWLPAGQMYFEFIYLVLLCRLKNYFGWEKLKLMAHSLSASISFWYASLYPDNVSYVIAIDIIKFPSTKIPTYNKYLAKGIAEFLQIDEGENNPPSYKKEVLIERWISATKNSLDEAACKVLMTRGVTEKPDGTVYLNRDPRLRVLPVHLGLSHDQLKEMARLINCPYLVIKSETNTDGKQYTENLKYFYDILEIIKQSSRDCHFHLIPGTHHIHLRDAPAIAKVIHPFLEKYN